MKLTNAFSTVKSSGILSALSACLLSLQLPIAASSADSQQNTSNAENAAQMQAQASQTARTGQFVLQPPRLEALITITRSLDPFRLDATGSRVISLGEVLKVAVTQNLDIRIRQEDVASRKWTLVSSYGGFLPNLSASYRYQYLLGSLNLPLPGSAGSLKVDQPFIIASTGFTYNVYQGGKVLFTALQNRNNLRASRYQQSATLSDTLYEATRRYLNLVLSEALLQIRIKAVETSAAQLELNENLLKGGKATRLDVLQARTQLSTDRQNLIDQQISRRNASIDLSDLLNIEQGVDLLPTDRTIQPRWLISEASTPASVLKTAIENRPELKQYRELWLAARKTVGINASRLQPTLQFFGNIYGIGQTLGDSSTTTVTAVNPTTQATVPVGTPGSSIVQKTTSHQIAPLYTLGYIANWNINGLGATDIGNIQAARAQSRQAMLELNKRFNTVTNETRQSYLRTLSNFRKLDETNAKVESAAEELRLAQMRFQNGVGKNIDVLKAQEDVTSSLIENAQAMITFNISEAQLLRDAGLISVDNLLTRTPIKLE